MRETSCVRMGNICVWWHLRDVHRAVQSPPSHVSSLAFRYLHCSNVPTIREQENSYKVPTSSVASTGMDRRRQEYPQSADFLLGCRGWCWTEFTSLVLSWLPPRDSCLLKINEILDFLAKYTPVDTPQNLQLTEDSSIRIPCILGSHIVHSKGQLS